MTTYGSGPAKDGAQLMEGSNTAAATCTVRVSQVSFPTGTPPTKQGADQGGGKYDTQNLVCSFSVVNAVGTTIRPPKVVATTATSNGQKTESYAFSLEWVASVNISCPLSAAQVANRWVEIDVPGDKTYGLSQSNQTTQAFTTTFSFTHLVGEP
jgi:hypothetical protein